MPRSGLLAATLEDSGAAVIFVVRSGFMGDIMGRRSSEVRPRRTANIENVAKALRGLARERRRRRAISSSANYTGDRAHFTRRTNASVDDLQDARRRKILPRPIYRPPRS